MNTFIPVYSYTEPHRLARLIPTSKGDMRKRVGKALDLAAMYGHHGPSNLTQPESKKPFARTEWKATLELAVRIDCQLVKSKLLPKRQVDRLLKQFGF